MPGKIFKFNFKNTSALFALVFLFVLLLPKNSKALTMSPVRVELSSNPGENVVSRIKAVNPESSSKTYFTNVYTFEAGDENGTPVFRVVKSDLASWIQIDSAITLGPYESKQIPFTISVPKTAEAGGYFAGIFLTQTQPKNSEGNEVALSSEVGSLVLFRINGNIQNGVDILEFDANQHKHWYNNLPVNFYFRFQNSGQTWVKPLGDILVKNIFGQTTKIFPANKDEGNVLPQSIRRFANSWHGKDTGPAPQSGFWNKVIYQWRNFAFGPYTVNLNLAYGLNSLQSSTATTHVWVIPWQLLLVEIIFTVLAFYISRNLIRRYNKMIITKAKAEKSSRKRII